LLTMSSPPDPSRQGDVPDEMGRLDGLELVPLPWSILYREKLL